MQIDAQLTSKCSARDAWDFWSQMVERPDALRMVCGVNQARLELSHIHCYGIEPALMEHWLRKWPTAEGWRLFQADRLR